MITLTCEIQCLVYLIQDFKVPFERPSLLYYDNDSKRYIVTNTVFHGYTKHIEINCHIVREIEEGFYPSISYFSGSFSWFLIEEVL